MTQSADPRPLLPAGLVLGAGLAGFLDGIILHQVLQWHYMLSSAGYPPTTVAGLEVNTLADGLFHLGSYLVMIAGLLMLWRAGRRGDVAWSPRTFAGAILLGGGGFNVIEGLVDHYILGIHHVRPGPDQAAWDLGFLVLGALVAGLGFLLQRRAALPTAASQPGR